VLDARFSAAFDLDSLLPRHWRWLASQPGGPSVTLRRLVEHARTATVEKDRSREATDAT